MAKLTLEIDTEALDRLRVNAFRIDGEAILFGIPEPAPMHRGRGTGKPPTVTTAFTLARVEYGPPRSKAPTPTRRPARRRGRAGRLARSVLRRLLRGFRRGRALPRRAQAVVPTSPKGERPVIRWVAATKRPEMVDGFRAAAKQALGGRDPGPNLEVLGKALAEITRARLTDVGGVDTGQTRAAITHKIVRRYGPGSGG